MQIAEKTFANAEVQVDDEELKANVSSADDESETEVEEEKGDINW